MWLTIAAAQTFQITEEGVEGSSFRSEEKERTKGSQLRQLRLSNSSTDPGVCHMQTEGRETTHMHGCFQDPCDLIMAATYAQTVKSAESTRTSIAGLITKGLAGNGNTKMQNNLKSCLNTGHIQKKKSISNLS